MKKSNSLFLILSLLVLRLVNYEISNPAPPQMYQEIAKQIVEDYKIKDGICIDIGCGSAPLTIELAKLTNLQIYGLDIDWEAVASAKRNVAAAGFEKRIQIIRGDVHDMLFKDNFADLIVSRGSLPFWKDKVKAFKEIHRVLKKGGIAFIGGGHGRAFSTVWRQISPEELEKLSKKEALPESQRKLKYTPKDLYNWLKAAKMANYKIFEELPGCQDCSGWAEIRK